MIQQEQDFMNYFYTEYIINKNSNIYFINNAYDLLYNDKNPVQCNSCVKDRFNHIKTKYVLLLNAGITPKINDTFEHDLDTNDDFLYTNTELNFVIEKESKKNDTKRISKNK